MAGLSGDVLVVGGGLAGLASAFALARRGLRVVVVERETAVGGRARSWVDDTTGDVVDIGPHVLLTEYPNLLSFLEMLGTRDRIVWDCAKVITIAENGRPVRIKGSRLPAPFHLLPSLLRVPNLSTRDLLSNHRVSWFVLRASESDLQRLDAVDALSFLRHMKVRQRLMDWFWATVSMTILNVPLERCSTAALLRFYRILLAHPDLHLGFADVGLSELYARQAVRDIERHGGRVLTGTEVTALSTEQGKVTGARLAGGGDLAASHCIAAVEPGNLARILPEDVRSGAPPFADLDLFQPCPYISSYIWFDRKLTHERNWAQTWSPDTLNYDCYDLSNIRRGWADRPSVIASNIIHADRVGHLSDAEVVEATVREIAGFAPAARRATVRHARVHRIPMAIPCPLPGLEHRRPAVETGVPGLYLAGDWVDTGLPASMEGAIRGGWLAAEAVLATLGRHESLALEVEMTRGLMSLTSRGPGGKSRLMEADGGKA